MKAFFIFLLTIYFSNAFAQDTMFLRGAYPIIAKVIEVDENDYVIFQKIAGNRLVKDKIKSTEVKFIKYKNGYEDKFIADSKYTYVDKVQLIDSRIIQCLVVEIEEDSIKIDTNNSFDFFSVPKDSIAYITYRNGVI